MVRCSRCRIDGHKCTSSQCPYYVRPVNVSLDNARKERDKYKEKCDRLERKLLELSNNTPKKRLEKFKRDSNNLLALTAADEFKKKEPQPSAERLAKLEASSKKLKLSKKQRMLHQNNLNYSSSVKPVFNAPSKTVRKSSSPSSRSRSSSSSESIVSCKSVVY